MTGTMQSIKPIRVFLEVVTQGSFAKAARSLHMTPASVTRIIAQLEDELGQQLLLRTTRRVSLTGAGAMVAARYRPVIDEFDRITDEVTRATRPDHGHLTINAPMSFGMRLLPGLIGSFHLAYPNISLDVQMTDALVDIVAGSCDLAIRISGSPQDKSTIWRRICKVPRCLVAAPALFDRVPRPHLPEDLDPAICLSYGTSREAEIWNFRRAGVTRSIRAGTGIVSNNGEFLLGLAATGHGIVNLPGFLVREALARGQIEPVLPEWEIPPLDLMLYYPPYQTLPPLVDSFTDFFVSYMKTLETFEFMGKD